MFDIKSFTDLFVWQKAHKFVVVVYKITESFPKSETYGLSSQFRRASVSVPANIAEGFGKKTKPDKCRFLNISEGSLEECRYYVILSKDLGYIKNEDGEALLSQIEEVSRMLAASIAKMRD